MTRAGLTYTLQTRLDAPTRERLDGLRATLGYPSYSAMMQAAMRLLLAAPPAAIVIPGESRRRVPKMRRGKSAAEKKADYVAREEAKGRVMYTHRGLYDDDDIAWEERAHAKVPPGFTTLLDNPVHQPAKAPPPGSAVETDKTALENFYRYGDPPYIGTYYNPAMEGGTEKLMTRQGVIGVRRFGTPDKAGGALWEEWGRQNDAGTYEHEDDWHTFPGASPAEVLGEHE